MSLRAPWQHPSCFGQLPTFNRMIQRICPSKLATQLLSQIKGKERNPGGKLTATARAERTVKDTDTQREREREGREVNYLRMRSHPHTQSHRHRHRQKHNLSTLSPSHSHSHPIFRREGELNGRTGAFPGTYVEPLSKFVRQFNSKVGGCNRLLFPTSAH